MSAKKPIVVRIDGKYIREKQKNKRLEKLEKIGVAETAATEEPKESSIHTFSREYNSYSSTKSGGKKSSNFDMFKPIIIAIISAITIGSIMGFVMLKIIVNFDNNLNPTPAVVIPATQQGNEQNGNTEGNTTPTENALQTIKPMTAFVLQGGVFSSMENAELETTKFRNHGYAPVIWERDNQYFLLIKVAPTKEALQQDANQLMDNGIEVYAKEWQVGEKEIELSEAESDWFVYFQENWLQSVANGNLNLANWHDLLNQVPNESSLISDFSAAIASQLDSGKDANDILLSIWELYETMIATE